MKTKSYLACVFLMLIGLGPGYRSFGQLLPANRPEQDACNALKICGNGFTSPYSYQGHGIVSDLPSTPCSESGSSPPGAGEDNSMWLRLDITVSGVLVFTISPLTYTDDYDWAVLDVTGKSCSNISSADVVRCNFNNNVSPPPTPTSAITGLNMTAQALTTQAGAPGGNFLRRIDAVAGQSYLIMINNFGISGTQLGSGFTIDFSGSTAVFNDQVPPRMLTATSSCFSGNSTVLQLSEDVKCSSITATGSEFQVFPSGTIVTAAGTNCNASNQGYTDEIRLHFSPPLPPGTYTIRPRNGSDNNTILDLCDNAMRLTDSIRFTVAPPDTSTHVVDTIGCGSLVYRGVTYTRSTVLRDTLRNQQGCDSFYNVVHIKVYDGPEVFEEQVGDCDTVVFRGVTYLQNATVTDTFKSQQGCDSFLHVYHIYVEHFELALRADPPQPVIGDYVHLYTDANVPDYQVNAWYPKPMFSRQLDKENAYFIPHSDTIKVIATSALGCIDTAVLFVKADTLVPVVVVPNAFSPNGDGLNDVFEPLFVNKSGYVVKSFHIFNRWGQLVYKAEGTRKAAWNGYYYNKDKVADPGTYFYNLRVEFIDGTKTQLKGDVTIVP